MLLCSIKFVEIPLDFVDYCSYFVVLLRLNNAKIKFLLSIYKYIASSLILDPGFTREGSYVITHVRPSVVRSSSP